MSPTAAQLIAGRLMAEKMRKDIPAHRLPAWDAVIFAVEQVQLALAPTRQQYRPTKRADLETQVHAGYAATQLYRGV